jgi:hypothetical protein
MSFGVIKGNLLSLILKSKDEISHLRLKFTFFALKVATFKAKKHKCLHQNCNIYENRGTKKFDFKIGRLFL